MADPAWQPDYGPPVPHRTAGATVIGARRPLVAYNVNLATDRFDIARAVAAAVRQSSGGLPAVKAMAVRLEKRGIVQVSMNLTDYRRTAIPDAFHAVKREAAQRGASVLEIEIVGLAPRDAFAGADASTLLIRGFTSDMILEHRLGDHS
jgi:glutamate formiminotransferase